MPFKNVYEFLGSDAILLGKIKDLVLILCKIEI